LACNLLDSDLLETTISSFVASCASLESERPAALLLLEADQLRSDAQAVLAGTMSIGKLRLRTLATARTPLVDLAENGAYRPDLAFALSTVTIEIPALAERVQDIPLLAQHFLERYNAAGGKQLSGFATGAMEQLLAYSWPENVDELAEFVRQACHTAARPQVQAADLPEKVRVTASAEAHPPRREERIVLDEFLAEIERELLARAVRQTKGNKAKAARLLGVSRPRLLRRLDQFGMGDGS
jgi:DNA-binding NtrC family response regulator